MNKKITISDLSQLLSTNVSLINKKGWEDFLHIFFDQIKEALQAEGNVKIKGLGTFKVVTVDARKSKDVNTGANTIIPAHNKISFTPDSSLAEILNKPYAHFEPTYVLSPEGEVDAPDNEEEEENMIEDPKPEAGDSMRQSTLSSEAIMEEIKVEPEKIVEETKVESEKIVEETIAESEKILEETIAESEKIEEETMAEPEKIVEENKVEPEINEEETQEDNVAEESEEIEEEDPNSDDDENVETTPAETAAYASTFKRHDLTSEEDENDKNGHGKKLGIAIILFLCILAVVALVAWVSDPNIIGKLREKLSGNESKTEIIIDQTETEEAREIKEIEDQIIAEMTDNNQESIEQVDSAEKEIEEENTNTTETIEETSTISQNDNKNVEKNTNFKEDFVSYMKKKHPEMDILDQDEPTEEKLNNNSRLTLVSLQHYGAKDFWVYIYLYNKDVIKNPNNIKAGTKIKIPKLDKTKFVNPNLEHSILTAKEVQHTFVK